VSYRGNPLPDHVRIAIKRRWLWGWSVRRIAKTLGIGNSTVQRALKGLTKDTPIRE
jgi:IS30 family transposase